MLEKHHLDIKSRAFIDDPYPTLQELRDHIPVFYDEHWNQVFFTRYEDISTLLKDRRLGRSILHIMTREQLGWPPPDPRQADFDKFQSKVFMDWEPPEHTRIRLLVAKAFTPRHIENMRPKLEATTKQLIDNVINDGTADFVHDIAEPLPVIMIADLLGVPEDGRDNLRPWSAAIVKMYEQGYSDQEQAEASTAARDFMAYIGELADERRTHPQDDLITALVQVEEEGQKLSEDELRATCIFLLNAGHEATVNASSLGLLALLRQPDKMQQMKDRVDSPDCDDFLKTATEEMLRYDSPLPMFERWVLEDMAFNGVELKQGMEVALIYASGNRDPRHFDNADELDLTRKDNMHLTFGMGTHYCMGAALARLELQILFKALMKRMPDISLNGDPIYSDGFVIRGLKSLPVAF